MCISGYNGANCENNINDCAGRPCKNNATCNDLVNSYTCDCSATGFEGPNCEQNINECLGNPCLNGARCNDTLGDYSCFCPGNYCGKNCQRTGQHIFLPQFSNPDFSTLIFFYFRFLLRDYMCIGVNAERIATVTHCQRASIWNYDPKVKLV